MILKTVYQAIGYVFHIPNYFYVLWRLYRMKRPIVVIFGGTHAQSSDFFYKQTYKLASLLVDAGWAVISGGGPGVMEAALCGAMDNKKNIYAFGIAVHDVDAQFVSHCQAHVVDVQSFSARKWLLIGYSSAFVVMPGGLGTMDELSEVLNLMKTKKIMMSPIILVGSDYWKPYLIWLDIALAHGYISSNFKSLFMVKDTVEEVLAILGNTE